MKLTITPIEDVLNRKSENLVKNWIDESVEIIEDKSEEEIRKNTLKEIKEELSKLKSEKDLNSIKWSNYNFLFMLSDVYNFTPEEIISRVEKDLVEVESN